MRKMIVITALVSLAFASGCAAFKPHVANQQLAGTVGMVAGAPVTLPAMGVEKLAGKSNQTSSGIASVVGNLVLLPVTVVSNLGEWLVDSVKGW